MTIEMTFICMVQSQANHQNYHVITHNQLKAGHIADIPAVRAG